MPIIDRGIIRGEQPDLAMRRIFARVANRDRHDHFHIKVGITNNPRIRWGRHEAAGWKTMTVIYEHAFRECAQYVERRVVREFQTREFVSPGYIHNIARGGEGRIPEEDMPTYVYLLGAPSGTRFATSIWS